MNMLLFIKDLLASTSQRDAHINLDMGPTQSMMSLPSGLDFSKLSQLSLRFYYYFSQSERKKFDVAMVFKKKLQLKIKFLLKFVSRNPSLAVEVNYICRYKEPIHIFGCNELIVTAAIA